MPLLSIITINLNHRDGLERTLASVQEQTFSDLEHIVIDGGSTDGSTELIRKNANRLAYWCSEPDHGVYHAMNKGVAAANGFYLLFLNAGDTLDTPQVLSDVFEALDRSYHIVYGNIRLIQPGTGKQRVIYFPPKINGSFLKNYSMPHPCTFISRELINHAGGYDASYRIAGDYALFVKVFLNYCIQYKHLNRVIATFHMDGMSTDPANKKLIRKERQRALRNIVSFPYGLWLSLAKYFYRTWWVMRKALLGWQQ